jgi:hypothetical protein
MSTNAPDAPSLHLHLRHAAACSAMYRAHSSPPCAPSSPALWSCWAGVSSWRVLLVVLFTLFLTTHPHAYSRLPITLNPRLHNHLLVLRTLLRRHLCIHAHLAHNVADERPSAHHWITSARCISVSLPVLSSLHLCSHPAD